MDVFDEAGGKQTAADGRKQLQSQLARARAAVAYLKDRRHRSYQPPEAEGVESPVLDLRDMALFRIDEITYEEKGPRREAMENIFGTFRNIRGVNLLYLILGDAEGVHFYLGVARDKSYQGEMVPNLIDIGNYILAPAIRGNFRGCTAVSVKAEERRDILHEIRAAKECGILEGVPTIDEKSEDFQGVERLVDVMLGGKEEFGPMPDAKDRFGLVVIAKPYTDAEIDTVEDELHALYDLLAPLAHTSLQYTESDSENESMNQTHSWDRSASHGFSKSENTSDSTGETHGTDQRKDEASNVQVGTTDNWSENDSHNPSYSHNEQHRHGETQSDSDGWTDGSAKSHGFSGQRMDNYTTGLTESTTQGESHSRNTSKGEQKNWNVSDGHHKAHGKNLTVGAGRNATLSYQMELERKTAADWLKYIDEILLPRLDNGRGKGLFLACAYVFGDMPTTVLRLANTLISLYSGSKGNKTPLVFHDLSGSMGSVAQALKNLQVPQLPRRSTTAPCLAAGLSRHMTKTTASCGNWLSSDQLSILAGMPQKEVIGLRLREEVEFGLNVAPPPDQPCQPTNDKLLLERPCQCENDALELGYLVQCGSVQEKIPVHLSRKNLDKHVFVTGVTGGGKTMTCQNLLVQSAMPFLVIEPAKTEYRILKDQFDDLIIFTPGDNDVAPFFLNPFELFPGESITSRADMLKATFEATFEMQAAIPQILEAGIYRIYEDKGWNVGTNRWRDKEPDDPDGPFADGVYAFPTMQDYYDIMETIIAEQGFDERLYSEYLGTVHAYLQGLLVGAKGLMMNAARSVDFRDLVNRHVVIELDAIRSGAEKSLIIGFVLTNLLQAVRAEHFEASQKDGDFRHITLVEEAHRLMSRYEPGDSLNKKHGVEVFANMLAEVRKYGESMIIADQIPDKMTPEVLKNTNTKIVHKLFAQDDKEAIGNTMALNKEQKAFLSNLVAGRAIVFSQNWSKAMQVQVKPVSWTTDYKEIQPKEIRALALKYYREQYRHGILKGLERLDSVTEADVEAYLRLMADGDLPKRYQTYKITFRSKASYEQMVASLAKRLAWGRKDVVLAYFYQSIEKQDFRQERYDVLQAFVESVAAGDAWTASVAAESGRLGILEG